MSTRTYLIATADPARAERIVASIRAGDANSVFVVRASYQSAIDEVLTESQLRVDAAVMELYLPLGPDVGPDIACGIALANLLRHHGIPTAIFLPAEDREGAHGIAAWGRTIAASLGCISLATPDERALASPIAALAFLAKERNRRRKEPLRILVASTSPGIAQRLAAVAGPRYRFRAVCDVPAAVRAVADRPSLCVVDLGLPGAEGRMGGLHVVQACGNEDVPCILLHDFLKQGARAFVRRSARGAGAIVVEHAVFHGADAPEPLRAAAPDADPRAVVPECERARDERLLRAWAALEDHPDRGAAALWAVLATLLERFVDYEPDPGEMPPAPDSSRFN